jgi:hypothetical protein
MKGSPHTYRNNPANRLREPKLELEILVSKCPVELINVMTRVHTYKF